jgi:nucleotide-binding universal stress UspA family protein
MRGRRLRLSILARSCPVCRVPIRVPAVLQGLPAPWTCGDDCNGDLMNRPLAATKIYLSKILLATDFSYCSHAALPYAVSIAKQYGSQLLVAHVATEQSAELRASEDEIFRQTGKHAAVETVREFAAQLDGCRHELLIRRGSVWTELSEIIGTNRIDLMVIGTCGKGDSGKTDLGSTARQALRHSPCPVFTVGPNVALDTTSTPEIREVLYPTKLEPEAHAAEAYAVSLASKYQAHLSVLHATEKQNGTSAGLEVQRLYGATPYDIGLLRRPTTFVKYGPPVERILEAEHERGADLIVLGANRADEFSDVPSYLAGAGVEKIVTRAHCPVLTICS